MGSLVFNKVIRINGYLVFLSNEEKEHRLRKDAEFKKAGILVYERIGCKNKSRIHKRITLIVIRYLLSNCKP